MSIWFRFLVQPHPVQSAQMVEVNGESRVIPIPVMIVVKSTVDLPEQLGLNSVQMEKETIEPMSKFKMGWQLFDIPE